MTYPRLLVSATDIHDRVGALVEVDLDAGSSRVVLPYRVSGLWTSPDEVLAAHIDPDKTLTRLEAFNRRGLAWARRIANCIDTHCLAVLDDEILLVSTGTNQVITLDRDGRERSRWTLDPQMEPDACHFNHLVRREGRWLLSCFGRFERYRDWAAKPYDPTGLVLEIPSGRAVVSGLTRPHNPVPMEQGWLVCNSLCHQLVLCPYDGGPHLVVAEFPSQFPRGVLRWQDKLLVGLCNIRYKKTCPVRSAQIAVLSWPEVRVEQLVSIPYREIGHVELSPHPAVVRAMRDDAQPALYGSHEPFDQAQRAGSVVVLGDDPETAAQPGTVRIAVANGGDAMWSHINRPMLHVGCQYVDGQGRVLSTGAARTQLPAPIPPRRTLTFRAAIDAMTELPPEAAAVRITLVHEPDHWWEASETWTPAVVPLEAFPTSTASDGGSARRAA